MQRVHTNKVTATVAYNCVNVNVNARAGILVNGHVDGLVTTVVWKHEFQQKQPNRGYVKQWNADDSSCLRIMSNRNFSSSSSGSNAKTKQVDYIYILVHAKPNSNAAMLSVHEGDAKDDDENQDDDQQRATKGINIKATLKAALQSVPDKGKANIELIQLISKQFRIPKTNISIRRGETSRHKLLAIEAINVKEIEAGLKNMSG